MADPLDALLQEFGELRIAAHHFPMWKAWGMEDESTAVHSLGLSYLTTIGQSAGYVCCSEFPVAGHRVRADSVWWERSTRDVAALFEFERYKGGGELKDKVKNLLRAHHYLGRKASVLGLAFWTKNFYSLSDEALGDLWRILEQGFEAEDHVRIPPASPRLLRVFEFLHHQVGAGRHTLKGVIERKRP